jgi:hypothetical protein
VRRPFKHYRTPLAKETRESIVSRYEKLSGSKMPGEAMFTFCFHYVKERSAASHGRLANFLNMYGFARNMSFATLLLCGVFIIAAWRRHEPHFWQLAAVCVIASVTLFYRYLKYFRIFSTEVFTALLAIREDKSQAPSDQRPATP